MAVGHTSVFFAMNKHASAVSQIELNLHHVKEPEIYQEAVNSCSWKRGIFDLEEATTPL